MKNGKGKGESLGGPPKRGCHFWTIDHRYQIFRGGGDLRNGDLDSTRGGEKRIEGEREKKVKERRGREVP